MADLIEHIYPFDFSVLQLQSCQNATCNMMRFITRFPHVGGLFPPTRSHFVDILPYLFPVVKATKHTYHMHKPHAWFGICALPVKKPAYHGFFWLYFYLCMWNFGGFFPRKKAPTQKLQQPGSWARVSKSLEAGLSCHVG